MNTQMTEKEDIKETLLDIYKWKKEIADGSVGSMGQLARMSASMDAESYLHKFPRELVLEVQQELAAQKLIEIYRTDFGQSGYRPS